MMNKDDMFSAEKDDRTTSYGYIKRYFNPNRYLTSRAKPLLVFGHKGKMKNKTKVFNWQNLCVYLAQGSLYWPCLSGSSMPYTKQTSVPFLEQHLAQKPLENWLSQIRSDMLAKQYSVMVNIGYYKFRNFYPQRGLFWGCNVFLLGRDSYLF